MKDFLMAHGLYILTAAVIVAAVIFKALTAG